MRKTGICSADRDAARLTMSGVAAKRQLKQIMYGAQGNELFRLCHNPTIHIGCSLADCNNLVPHDYRKTNECESSSLS